MNKWILQIWRECKLKFITNHILQGEWREGGYYEYCDAQLPNSLEVEDCVDGEIEAAVLPSTQEYAAEEMVYNNNWQVGQISCLKGILLSFSFFKGIFLLAQFWNY